MYVADIVTAILSAAATDVEGAINLGSGVETSLVDLLDAIVEATPTVEGPLAGDSAPEFLPARRDEVKRNYLDTSRAAELLGWSATTPLASGLGKTLESL